MKVIEVTANVKTDRIVYQIGRPTTALELKRFSTYEDVQMAAQAAQVLLATRADVVSVILTKVEVPDNVSS